MSSSGSLSCYLLCIYSSSSKPKTNPLPYKSQTLTGKFTCSVRLKTIPKWLPHKKNIATSLETSPPHKVNAKRFDRTQSNRFSSSDSYSIIFKRIRDGFKLDDLGMEIWSIALPAALALAADPIASLIDTAFVGHLGSVELAAVGVSVSVFNLVSKLFNVPLLNVTTSFVAEEQALNTKGNGNTSQIGNDHEVEEQGKKLLPSISTSLALATGIGVAEAVALSCGSSFLLNIMGIPAGNSWVAGVFVWSLWTHTRNSINRNDSPMRVPAENFLTLRAFGAPPIVIALAAQGAFRGFMDTKTPLYTIVAGNLLNAILAPILIFFFHMGIGGAAVAAVISEYLIAFILLWKLSGKVLLMSPEVDGGRIIHYLKSGGLLIGRTIAVLLTMTLATSAAAREGPIPMAGHQICVQVWLTLSLLTDALALTGQALIAASYSQGNYERAQQVVIRLLQIGLTTGVSLAVLLFFGFGAFSHLFTTNTEVLSVSWSGLFFVAGSQPMNAIAFVLDGLYYGASDFEYAAYSMVLVALISSAFILASARMYGLTGVWTGLFLFMTLRVIFGIGRLGTKSGPWKIMWSEIEQSSE